MTDAAAPRPSDLPGPPVPAAADLPAQPLPGTAEFLEGLRERYPFLPRPALAALRPLVERSMGALRARWPAARLHELYVQTPYREGLQGDWPAHAASWCVCLDPDPGRAALVPRAASLVAAALEFHRRLERGCLAPDVVRGRALDMSQYRNFFGRSVLPGDGTRNVVYQASRPRDVVVIVRGRTYRLEVHAAGEAVSCATLERRLAAIVADARAAPGAARGPASATTWERRAWAAAQRRLRRRPENAAALDAIHRALFVLALDLDAAPATLAEAAFLTHVGRHGNRWYDKSLQIVVSEHGGAGLVGSFGACLDGTVATRFAADLQALARAAASTPRGDAARGDPDGWARLDWVVPHDLRARLTREEARFRAATDTRDRIVRYEGVGAAALRRAGVSPDAAFHLALRLAAATCFDDGREVRQFALLNLRHFARGFCTSVSVATPEADAFVRAAVAGRADPELRPLLGRAVAAHRRVVRREKRGVNAGQHLAFLLHHAPAPYGPLLRLLFNGAMRLAPPVAVALRASAVALPPGVAAVGRFGYPWPGRGMITLHYALEEERVTVVFLSGAGPAGRIDELARRLGTALELVARITRGAGCH